MAADNSPDEKGLRMIPFVIQATRGVIRDQNTRRKTMFVVLVVALALLFSGLSFLQSALNPGEHPIWFILFWATCAWLTLTALLLAIFDLLIVKAEARKAQRALRGSVRTGSPRSTTPKQSGLAKPFGVDE